MINLGTVRPGTTIRIPFCTFDKDDGSSVTMTNFAAADILVYKDGSTTERASTSGYTATTDFDGKTGKHVAVINLADNTTADFWAAGSEYLVGIDSVTVDTVNAGPWIARFTIGYPSAVLDTTIATLSSQTSFTLTVGPAEDDALNGMWAMIHDAASAVQLAKVLILDYTGSTKTVTLAAGATFTVAAKDNFSVIDMAPLQPTTTGRTLDISATGEAGVDWANIGSPTTAVSLAGTTVATTTNLTNAATNGDLTTTMKASVNTEANTALADTGVTTVRTAYLDKLNITGNVASSGEVTNIQNNTRMAFIVPEQIIRPTSGTVVNYMRLYLYDSVGNMEAPDSAPVMELRNVAGTDLSARLTSVNGTLESTGVYRWEYTSSSAHTLEQILWSVTIIENGATRYNGRVSWITDTYVTDFTSSDRTTLNNLAAGVNVSSWAGQTVFTSGDDDLPIVHEGTNGANFVNIPWNPNWDNEVQSEVADALVAYSASTLTANQVDTLLSTNHGNGAWITATGFAVPGSQMSLVDGAITEAKITTPAETSGRPTTILGMVRRLFEWQSNRRQRNRATGAVTLSNAAESSTLETQTQSTSGDVDTISKGT